MGDLVLPTKQRPVVSVRLSSNGRSSPGKQGGVYSGKGFQRLCYFDSLATMFFLILRSVSSIIDVLHLTILPGFLAAKVSG